MSKNGNFYCIISAFPAEKSS